MIVAPLLGTAVRLAPPPLAKVAIDDGITPGDTTVLYLVVAAFVVSALVLWGMTTVQTSSSAGSASGHCRTCASSFFAPAEAVGFYSRNARAC